jgi:hypothetical protein
MLVGIFTFIFQVTVSCQKGICSNLSCNTNIRPVAQNCVSGERLGARAAASVHSSLAHWHGLVQSTGQS